LEYVNEEGNRAMPVMIHCAIAGSLERFLSVYLEHSAGVFPLWLAPNQIKIIPIKNDLHLEYAENVYRELKESGIRVDLDSDKNGLGKKVREAKDMKYPYWIVIGDAEITGNTVTLESLSGDKMSVSLPDLIKKLKEEISNKK
jgi:threonyl-tRNA synthetase